MKVPSLGTPPLPLCSMLKAWRQTTWDSRKRLGWSAHVRPVRIWQPYFICTGHGYSRTKKLGTQAVRSRRTETRTVLWYTKSFP